MWAIPDVHAVTATMSGLSDEAASLTASAFFASSAAATCSSASKAAITCSGVLAWRSLSANPGFIKYLDNSARAAK